MFYCQHVLGIGHLVRSSEIVRALQQDFDVLFVSGGAPVRGFPFPDRARVEALPPLETDEEFSGLRATGNASLEQVKEIRKELLLRLLDDHRPDVLVVELFPFGRKGFSFELLPLLERARAQGTKIVSSVRDLLVRKQDQAAREEWSLKIFDRFFDLLLVHSDPHLVSFDESFDNLARLEGRLRYTGYVSERGGSPNGERDSSAAGDTKAPHILVSVGGGRCEAGYKLIKTALESAKLERCALWKFEVLSGPLVPDDVYAAMQSQAEGCPNATLNRYAPDLRRRLGAADLSLSMAGYNTLMNILSTGARALVCPFTGNEDKEQEYRARKLEARGLLGVVEASALEAESLADAMQAQLNCARSAMVFDLSGAETTRLALLRLIKTRVRAASPPGPDSVRVPKQPLGVVQRVGR